MDKPEDGDFSEESIAAGMRALSCGDQEVSDLQLDPEVPKVECFFNWLPAEIERSRFVNIMEQNEIDSNTGLSVCLRVAVDAFEKRYYEDCEYVYYLILFGSLDEAKELLEAIKTKIENNDEIPQDRRRGYLYVVKALDCFRQCDSSNSNNASRNLEVSLKLDDYDILPTESKITVIRMKFMAFLNFRITRADSTPLDALVKLEPENAMWYYFLYKYYRVARKDGQWSNRPDKRETWAISRAMDLDPDNVLYMLGGFQNLSYRLRHMHPLAISEDRLFSWRDQNFTSVDEIVAYMKDKTSEILDTMKVTPDTGYFSSLFASVFSSYLPKRFQDLELAERCIDKAIAINPECTIINHRKGLMVWQKTHIVEDAAFYLWQACKFGQKNFGARMDLLHLLLSSAEENEDNIITCILECLEDGKVWGKKERSICEFLKGCFLLMINVKSLDVLNSWIEAYNLDAHTNHFIEVSRQARRYSWDENDFNFDMCRKVFDDLEGYDLHPEDVATTVKISEDITKAVEAAEEDGQRFTNRNTNNNTSDRRERGDTGNFNHRRGGAHSTGRGRGRGGGNNYGRSERPAKDTDFRK